MVRPKATLKQLMRDFDTDKECREVLETLRWPSGVCCLRCGSEKISRITTRKQFDCGDCRYRFSVTTGTIFHDSHLPLPTWFMATLLMCEAKKGMSANQMKRTLGVAHKTAWYLCHRIREAMVDVNPEPLTGTVEIDETYIGGKWRGRRVQDDGRKDWRQRKTLVMGAIERGGNIRLSCRKESSATKATVDAFIKQNVADNCERIYTDESNLYQDLIDENTTHERVNHLAKEYVRGDVHTNTIESAFGLFKRALVGSFHQVSTKHLDRYLDEFEFRYNNRKNQYLFRDTLTKLVNAKAMPYEKLTA
jgi:transposase-like protein